MAAVTLASNPDFEGGPAAVVSDVFNVAWDRAEAMSSQSRVGFNEALAIGGSGPSMNAASLSFDPAVVEPNVTIPQNADGASVAKFHELAEQVMDKLAGLFGGYITDYFPNECGYLEKAQQWICDTLTSGGTGINADVEDQIWQRDRARVLNEVSRANQEVIANFAARGFPIPPGAAAHQMQMQQIEGQNKIGQQSRDIAIKQVEIEIENVRFAVDKAISLYSAAMSAASDYIRALSVGYNSSMQLVPSVTDSQSKLIGAASEYYRARIAVKELELKSKLPNAEYEQAARVRNGDWLMAMVNSRVQAAVSEAQGLSTQAAAALNGLHASASISGSSGNTVGFSYSGDVNAEVSPKTSA
jgi:hypothetical protein